MENFLYTFSRIKPRLNPPEHAHQLLDNQQVGHLEWFIRISHNIIGHGRLYERMDMKG